MSLTANLLTHRTLYYERMAAHTRPQVSLGAAIAEMSTAPQASMRVGTSTLLSVAVQDTVPYVNMSSVTDATVRMAMASIHAEALNAIDDTARVTGVLGRVITIMTALFPGLHAVMTADNSIRFAPEDLPQAVRTYVPGAQGAVFPANSNIGLGLTFGAAAPPVVQYTSAALGVFAALMVYAIGKNYNDTTQMTPWEHRIAAFSTQVGVTPANVPYLSTHVPSEHALKKIHTAFAYFGGVRTSTLEALVGYMNAISIPAAARPIRTAMSMMVNAQMAYVPYIKYFVDRHPLVLRSRAFRPFLSNFYGSIIALHNRVPAAMRPYYKVYYGDAATLFSRQTLGPLIRVAIEDEIAVHPATTMQHFDVSNLPATLHDAFLEVVAEEGDANIIPAGDVLQQQFGYAADTEAMMI